jgi:hypothetical protein
MYADGHLSLVEEEHLQKLLVAMGFLDEIDRAREIDGAVTRIRPSIQSIYKAKELALKLADAFTTRPQQVKVYAAVEELMTSDNNVSSRRGCSGWLARKTCQLQGSRRYTLLWFVSIRGD